MEIKIVSLSRNVPYLPKSYPFSIEKQHALRGYLELALGVDIQEGEATQKYEVMRINIKRFGESVTLTLYRKEDSTAVGTLTPQGTESVLMLETHAAIQAMKF